MPSLVMRAPSGSLLEQTSRFVVRRQIKYGAALGVPWGVSDRHTTRDLELTYQYSNFGARSRPQARAQRRRRVAPYATALATMVDAKPRSESRLAAAGGRGDTAATGSATPAAAARRRGWTFAPTWRIIKG
jgi:cyclic beta-1,2-glucan synthetase